jgi:hypothetical protein
VYPAVSNSFSRFIAVLVLVLLAAGAHLLPAAETFQGQWQKIVPLRHGVFSIAMGNQIMSAPSETGRPEGSSFLLGSLDKLSPPVLRLPGGDSLNSWNWTSGLSRDAEGGPRHARRRFRQALPRGARDLRATNKRATGFRVRLVPSQRIDRRPM